jgi:beta-lactamase regulating signal transducer with metallopeptidase domain
VIAMQIWTWLGVMTLWTGGLLVLAWLADMALRRVAAPGLRMALYAVVLVRVALPVDWQTPLGVLDEHEAATEVTRAAVDVPATAAPFVVATEGTASASVAAPAIDMVALGIFAVYAVVALALLTVLVRRLRPIRAVLAESTFARMHRGVPVRVHAHAGPMVIGVLRPAIVVPEAMLTSLAPALVDAVLRHEHAHVRHRDGALAIVLALVCVVAWPLVPVWLAVARIRLLMELRADAAAVQTCDAPAVKGYRRLLLDLAQHRAPVHVLAPGLDPVASLRARLRAMSSRSRLPWLLQLAFVGPLAIALLVVAARRSGDARPQLRAEAPPSAPAFAVPAFPHCREHEGNIIVPAGDEVARAEARYLAGLAHLREGRTSDAAQDLGEAAWEAARLEYGLLAGESAAAMAVALHGGDAEAQSEALAWSRHAEAGFRRAGMAGPMAIEMHRALATLDERNGDEQAAQLRRTLAASLDDACEVVAR